MLAGVRKFVLKARAGRALLTLVAFARHAPFFTARTLKVPLEVRLNTGKSAKDTRFGALTLHERGIGS